MSVNTENELRDFHLFLGEQLASNLSGLTPEAAVDLWRDQHPSPQELAASVKAVRAALADMDAGDTGITLEEFKLQFRAKHGLPAEG